MKTLSGYKIEVIQQIKAELTQDENTGYWLLPSKYFMDYEPDYILQFADYSGAVRFIMDEVSRDLIRKGLVNE